MNRRAFLGTVAGGLLAAPFAAEAQQAGKVYRVAVLHLTSPPPPVVDAFRIAMRQLGWVEGQTLLIDYRGADDKGERFALLAGDIVSSRPDVIVTGTSGAAVAAKRATSTIPIVMAVSVDPVGLGVVSSLARPGGNVTGQAHFVARTDREATGTGPGGFPERLSCRDLLEHSSREAGCLASPGSEPERGAETWHPTPSRRGSWGRWAR